MRQQAAELAIKAMGITFTVYHEQDGSIDRAWPLDIIPRTISRKEWQRIEAGLIQRAAALNLFIDDVYHEQKFITRRARCPPRSSPRRRTSAPWCKGIKPPLGTWAHICGSDLIRDKDGTVYVLEDNLRVPSGVSYMLENRQVIKRVFPELFESAAILPVDDYPSQLYDMLAALSPAQGDTARGGGADAGHLQLGLLRARLPRAADGLRAGRGPRPRGRQRRLRLHADGARLDARRRDLPAHRRRLPRPGSVPQGFHARRAGPDARLGQGQRGAGERAGRRRRRRQARLYLRAGHDQVLPRRGRDPAPTCRRGAAASRSSSTHVLAPPRRAGGQAGGRLRRLRHADGADRPPRPSARSSRRR